MCHAQDVGDSGARPHGRLNRTPAEAAAHTPAPYALLPRPSVMQKGRLNLHAPRTVLGLVKADDLAQRQCQEMIANITRTASDDFLGFVKNFL